MSSIIAYFTVGNGIYSMTKAAIEKFCDALRLEMKKFGVQVSDGKQVSDGMSYVKQITYKRSELHSWVQLPFGKRWFLCG